MTSPLDDIRTLIAGMPAIAAADNADSVAAIAGWLRSAAERPASKVDKPVISLFAGAHGVARHGVSAMTPKQVTELAAAVSDETAPVARLCAGANIGLKMLDLALDLPSGDITSEPALDERGCAATFAFGMEAVAGGHDLVALDGFGAGLQTSAKALLASLRQLPAGDWTSDCQRADIRLREETAIATAVANHAAATDGLDLLARLGGREIVAMAGAIVAARYERIPVLLTGLPGIAAAAALQILRADALAHCRLCVWPGLAAARAEAEAMGLGGLGLRSLADDPGVDAGVSVGIVRAVSWASSS
jgi:nicotinate-nucleotide--dimethylbenzimidazole phosphoribosyltransferase